MTRFRALWRELAKFLVVGGVCFVVDFGIAHVLHNSAGVGPITAKAISTVIATALSYGGNRLWSFAHRVDTVEPTPTKDAALFTVINLAGLLLTLGGIALVEYGLNLRSAADYDLSQVFWTAIATLFRFYGYRRWVFTGDGAVSEAEREALV